MDKKENTKSDTFDVMQFIARETVKDMFPSMPTSVPNNKEVMDKLNSVEEKLDTLNNKLDTIFGNSILFNGKWIEL